MARVSVAVVVFLIPALAGCTSDGTESSLVSPTKEGESSDNPSPTSTTGGPPGEPTSSGSASGEPSIPAPTSGPAAQPTQPDENETEPPSETWYLSADEDSSNACEEGLLVASAENATSGGCLLDCTDPVFCFPYYHNGTSMRQYPTGVRVTGILWFYSRSPTTGSAHVELLVAGVEVGRQEFASFQSTATDGWYAFEFSWDTTGPVGAGEALSFKYIVHAPGLPNTFTTFGWGGSPASGFTILGEFPWAI